MAIDGDDAVGVFVDHDAIGVHAEGADVVLKFFCAVDDLALVQLVGQVGEDHRGKLYPDADVHTVGAGGDVQLAAGIFHPFASAPADGDNAVFAVLIALLCEYPVGAVLQDLDPVDGFVEAEFHMVLHLVVHVLQNDVVDICSQMTDGCLQKRQLVLHAELFELAAGCRIHLCSTAAVRGVDIVHIGHQLQGFALSDVLMERTAEVVGDVVLAVGEGAGAAEALHDRAGLALDAGLDLVSVDGAFTLFQRIAGLKDKDLFVRTLLHQLIGGKDSARSGTDNDYVIHRCPSRAPADGCSCAHTFFCLILFSRPIRAQSARRICRFVANPAGTSGRQHKLYCFCLYAYLVMALWRQAFLLGPCREP